MSRKIARSESSSRAAVFATSSRATYLNVVGEKDSSIAGMFQADNATRGEKDFTRNSPVQLIGRRVSSTSLMRLNGTANWPVSTVIPHQFRFKLDLKARNSNGTECYVYLDFRVSYIDIHICIRNRYGYRHCVGARKGGGRRVSHASVAVNIFSTFESNENAHRIVLYVIAFNIIYLFSLKIEIKSNKKNMLECKYKEFYYLFDIKYIRYDKNILVIFTFNNIFFNQFYFIILNVHNNI